MALPVKTFNPFLNLKSPAEHKLTWDGRGLRNGALLGEGGVEIGGGTAGELLTSAEAGDIADGAVVSDDVLFGNMAGGVYSAGADGDVVVYDYYTGDSGDLVHSGDSGDSSPAVWRGQNDMGVRQVFELLQGIFNPARFADAVVKNAVRDGLPLLPLLAAAQPPPLISAMFGYVAAKLALPVAAEFTLPNVAAEFTLPNLGRASSAVTTPPLQAKSGGDTGQTQAQRTSLTFSPEVEQNITDYLTVNFGSPEFAGLWDAIYIGSSNNEFYARIGDVLDAEYPKVLDLGTGTGKALLPTAGLLKKGLLVGLDRSETMLAFAREKFKELYPYLDMSFISGDAEALDAVLPPRFKDFDAVVARFLFNFIDLRRVLPQVFSRLKNGGRLTFNVFAGFHLGYTEEFRQANPFEEARIKVAKEVLEELVIPVLSDEEREGLTAAGHIRPREGDGWEILAEPVTQREGLDRAALIGALEAAGFENIVIEPVEELYPADEKQNSFLLTRSIPYFWPIMNLINNRPGLKIRLVQEIWERMPAEFKTGLHKFTDIFVSADKPDSAGKEAGFPAVTALALHSNPSSVSDEDLYRFFETLTPNPKTFFDFYKRGLIPFKLTPLDEVYEDYGREVNLQLTKENIYAFLEPILRFILQERPDEIIIVDRGARPFERPIRWFLKKFGLDASVRFVSASVQSGGHDAVDIYTLLKGEKDNIAGRHVLVIDDNVVRLRTAPIIENALRAFGAKRVSVAAAAAFNDAAYRFLDVATVHLPGNSMWIDPGRGLVSWTEWEENPALIEDSQYNDELMESFALDLAANMDGLSDSQMQFNPVVVRKEVSQDSAAVMDFISDNSVGEADFISGVRSGEIAFGDPNISRLIDEYEKGVFSRSIAAEAADGSGETAVTLEPKPDLRFVLRQYLLAGQEALDLLKNTEVVNLRIVKDGRDYGSVRLIRVYDLGGRTHLVLDRVNPDPALGADPAGFIDGLISFFSETASSMGYLFDLVSGRDITFSKMGWVRDEFNRRFKPLPAVQMPLLIKDQQGVPLLASLNEHLRGEVPFKVLSISREEKINSVLDGIVGPHLLSEELDGYKAAVEAFFGAASTANPARPALAETDRNALEKLLGIPGMRGALGICGTCMLAGLTGRFPFEWGFGFFTTALTAIPPADAPKEGLLRYFGIAPELRTYFTNLMLRLEQVLGERIQMLRPMDITPLMQNYLAAPDIKNLLETSYVDLKELAFEHDSLAALVYNSAQNMLFGGEESITFYRVHINMTTLNEKDDTNFHGGLYLDVVRSWLQEKFGRIYTIQNPERTTFEFITQSPRQVRSALASYDVEIRARLVQALGVEPRIIDRFMPKVILSGRTITLDNFFHYAVRTDEDMDAFREIIEFGGRFSVEEMKKDKMEFAKFMGTRPDFAAILAGKSKRLDNILAAMIIKAVLEVNAELAAQTTYFEKVVGFGKMVYTEDDLPKTDDPRFKVWRDKFLAPRIGFVGPGRYDPAYHNPELAASNLADGSFLDAGLDPKRPQNAYKDDPALHPLVNYILKVFPPYRRIAGSMSRRGTERGEHDKGGLIEQFLRKQDELAHAGRDDIPMLLAQWKGLANDLLRGFRNFYKWAVTEPRNAWVMKPHEWFYLLRGRDLVKVNADFMVQEAAFQGNRFIVTLEYDSLKAFGERYAGMAIKENGIVHYVDDKFYNMVRDAFFIVAARMNAMVEAQVDSAPARVGMPIIVPTGGDHKSVSLTFLDVDDEGRPVDISGRPVDPAIYLAEVQRVIRDELFHEFPFQDLKKVDMQEVELTGEGLDALLDPQTREDMRVDMRLVSQPQTAAGTAGSVTLAAELRDVDGREITVAEVVDYLKGKNIKVSGAAQLGVETYRLPMWQRSGGMETDTDYFVFGDIQPRGYEPFIKTLTITLVLAEHRPIKYPQDVAAFKGVQKKADEALGEAKKTGWPHKGLFVDLREEK